LDYLGSQEAVGRQPPAVKPGSIEREYRSLDGRSEWLHSDDNKGENEYGAHGLETVKIRCPSRGAAMLGPT